MNTPESKSTHLGIADMLKKGQALSDPRLQQIFKMAELGVLGISFFHELRQPLFAIKGFVQILIHEQRAAGKSDEHLLRILELSEELEQMAGRFLMFSHSPEDTRLPMNIQDAFQGALDMLEHRLKQARVAIAVNVEPDLPMICGNVLELQYVFVNIILNSVDAITSAPSGDARQIAFDVRTSADRGQVLISIFDSGPGIPDEVGDEIFDYFFTTKPVGKGTGLGLAVSRQIAEAHGGTLKVVSPPSSSAAIGGGNGLCLALPTHRAHMNGAAQP